MLTEKTFRTKTGFCHILPDKIVFTREGLVGDISTLTVGNKTGRVLTIYTIIGVGLMYSAYDLSQKGFQGFSFIIALLGVVIIALVFRSINISATPVIDREKIVEIRFRKGIRGVTRSRFEVLYKEDDELIRKRLIILPGILSNGEAETEKAVRILAEEKLIVS